LAVLYDNGHGVLQDYIRAHMRFNIAAANGDEEGREKRDALAKEMTSDQLAEAQKMALEMAEANPKLMGE
jgi:TPR repeat protein